VRPSFACEIAQDLPCGVVLAGAQWSVAQSRWPANFGPRFGVHLSDDPVGEAMGGVMKNVIFIASGIVAGRKLGENARATLITLGLAEAMRLGLGRLASAASHSAGKACAALRAPTRSHALEARSNSAPIV
jgi:glycerol-3-phosphate dehydrogenase (NAD(P)+)